MSGLVLGSVTSPWYIVIENETPDDPNLEWMDIPRLKREQRERMDKDREDGITLGQRLLRGAVEAVPTCSHNWGFTHFWGNPFMLDPCRITKIDGEWYKRKSCEHITEENARYSSDN